MRKESITLVAFWISVPILVISLGIWALSNVIGLMNTEPETDCKTIIVRNFYYDRCHNSVLMKIKNEELYQFVIYDLSATPELINDSTILCHQIQTGEVSINIDSFTRENSRR